jgi:hypothetical protein
MSVIEVQPPMEPKKTECVGFYLYGSGYYASEDSTQAILKARQQVSFCNDECPLMEKCYEQHVKRVREVDPEAVEAYSKLVEKAERAGVPESVVMAALTRRRKPDPFQAHALANFRRGKSDRARRDG